MAAERENVKKTFPWITYVLLTELFVKIIPALLLVSLNAVMIHGFNKVIQRRSTLCIQTPQLKKISRKIKPKLRKHLWKSKYIHHKISKMRMVSKKDKNIIKLLFFMSIIFFVTNIPMAIGRILASFGYHDEPNYKNFVVISNVLEVLYAASNFYLYCMCNAQIRRKVTIQITKTKFNCSAQPKGNR